ncbi:ribose-5-phosphate isomerase RpiA [bacterium CPR1]|nr:ribose-5-phosphate isomerase RpiA [bacterium CPR1]
MSNPEAAKWAAARRAVELVQPGQIVGLGTGTTAIKFLELLAQKVRGGLSIQGVPTSEAIARQAREWGIPLLESFTRVDLTVDGADQIDPSGRIIKGGGGALLREKLVALASGVEVIVVDPGKLVAELTRALPVEIIPFGVETTLARLRQAGVEPTVRPGFASDAGNLVADCAYPASLMRVPAQLHERLKSISGVVETGLFLELVDQLIIGHEDGRVEEREFRRSVAGR